MMAETSTHNCITEELLCEGESVASLIERLGPPPEDVVDHWCEELHRLARNIFDASHHSLPPIQLDQCMVPDPMTIRFHFELSSENLTENLTQVQSDESPEIAEATNLQRIAHFRRLVLGELSPVCEAIDPPVASISQVRALDKKNASRRNKLIALGTAAGCLGTLILFTIPFRIRDTEAETIIHPGSPANATSPQPPTSAEVTSSSIDTDENPIEETSIETMEELGAQLSLEPIDPVDPSSEVSLDFSTATIDVSISPRRSEVSLEVNAEPDASAEIGSVETKPRPSNLSSTENDPLGEDPSDAIAEAPQIVKPNTQSSLQLPLVSDTNARTEIGGISMEDLKLTFPNPVAIALDSTAPANILFRETRGGIPIAKLTTDGDSLSFSWLQSAKANSHAGHLHHGRLSDSRGGTVYLRPKIQTDPWPISFTESSFYPSWDLSGVLPPSVSRITIEFELPEQVEEAWIEPIDTASPRKTSGIAMLSMKDAEQVRLGIRFDIRTSSKLSCRIRMAARLDTTLPWESFTEAGLVEYANRLLVQSDETQKRIAEVEAIYDRTDTGGRRALRPLRADLKDQAKMLTTLSERVAELQTLAAHLTEFGKVRVSATVIWPDGEQVVLSSVETAEPQ